MLYPITIILSILLGFAIAAIATLLMKKSKAQSSVEYINPPDLSEPVGYSHITTASLTHAKIVCIAGQASLDKNKKNTVVGENDIAEQARNSYRNLGIALAAAGATPKNVLRSNIYTTASTENDISSIVEAREHFFKECKSAPPGALLGVPFLALPGLLVEVDAEAVVQESERSNTTIAIW
ncbi:MAG: RidA family protein [Legionellaceae bacterium]|nr:RidA family protein [Legionellaceae bacterium]